MTALAESELQEKILRERFKEPQEREKLDIRRQLPEHGRFDVIRLPAIFTAGKTASGVTGAACAGRKVLRGGRQPDRAEISCGMSGRILRRIFYRN